MSFSLSTVVQNLHGQPDRNQSVKDSGLPLNYTAQKNNAAHQSLVSVGTLFKLQIKSIPLSTWL